MPTKSDDKTREINGEDFHRDFIISDEQRASADDENRTIELSFSSETPVERWFGMEILSHEKGAVDFSRMEDGAPLLANHDHMDQIGVIEKAEVKGKKGRAVVRFSKSDRATEIWDDVKDGIRKNISVGYRILEYIIEEGKKSDTVTATRWMPHEVSFVSVPADPNVGVGRAQELETVTGGNSSDTNGLPLDRLSTIADNLSAAIDKVSNLSDPVTGDERILKPSKLEDIQMPDDVTKTTPEPVDIGKVQAEARKAEQDRIRAIMSNAEKFDLEELGRKAVEEGTPYADFNQVVVDELGKRNAKLLAAEPHKNGGVDLTQKEVREFSLHRLIRSELMGGIENGRVQANGFLPGDIKRDDAAFEYEVCNAARANLPSEYASQGFPIPERALSGKTRMAHYIGKPHSRAVIQANSSTTGDSLIAEVLRPDLFIDIFRNMSALAGSGMTVLSDLVGNVEIPRQKTKSEPAMTTQDTNAVETGPTFDQVTMSPKRAAAFKGFTHQLLLQSTPDIETLIRQDFAAEMALLVDRMGLRGSGSGNQPLGVMNVTGINTVAPSVDGAPKYAELVGMIEQCMIDNALGSSGYWIIDAKGWKNAMTTVKAAGTEGGLGSAAFILEGGMIVGYPYTQSQQIAHATENHLFGDFSQLCMGEWGSLDVIVDPYTEARKHNVLVTINRYIDFVVKQPAAFCKSN